MTKSKGIRPFKPRVPWTAEMDAQLIDLYPNTHISELIKLFGKSSLAVMQRAHKLGVYKSKQWIAETARLRSSDPNHGGRAHLFKKGCEPATKGKKQHEYMSPEAIERTKATRFKKGQLPHNALPVGSEVVRVDKRSGKSYILTKIEGNKKLVFKHIHVWEQANNKKLPAGHNIVFKDGNTHNCDISNLECISNAELMLRNTITQYPTELQRDIKKLGKLKRIIKKLES